MTKPQAKHLVVCVDNEGYRASLEKRKIYVALRDAAAEKNGLLRVVDESGEDYPLSENLLPLDCLATGGQARGSGSIAATTLCTFEGAQEFQQATNGKEISNHPSGDPTPSRADIQMTQAIFDIARPLGIATHDHIIVGKDGHASLKGLKLL